jgi:DNA-binding response OmpR family regulator
MGAHILIIDDDSAILEGVVSLLAQAGYRTSSASTGKQALSMLSELPDLLVLDLMLPDLDGYALCRQIRQLPDYVPILMLSARDELTDKVVGLELGADEYVTKPFEPRELLSRIRAMLRFAELHRPRSQASQLEQPVIYGPLKLWQKKHLLEVNGKGVELTPIEWALLELFIDHPGQVFGRETLLQHIWGADFMGDSRTVDTHVQRLRAKLELDDQHPRLIQTVRGFGYRLLQAENQAQNW